MPAWLLGTALGAGLSALQSAQANSDQKRAKRKYLEYLDKIKVNPLEEQKLLDSTGDVYLGQTVDAMNSSVGQGNLLNRDTQTALIKAKGLSARATAQAQQKQSIFDFNKNIDMKKAGAELQMPDQSLDFGAIAAGGLTGAQVGMGIESAMEENKYLEKLSNKFLGGDKAGLDYGKDFGLNQVIPNTVKGINEGLYKDDFTDPLDLNKGLPLANTNVGYLDKFNKFSKKKYGKPNKINPYGTGQPRSGRIN